MTPNKHTLLTTISLPPCSDVKLIDALGGMNPKQPCPRTVSMNQQTWDGCLSGASKSVGNESCVAMGLRIQVNPLLLDGQSRRSAVTRASECLERVGLAHRADHYPEEMSGGEMQRVAVARALVGEPEAVLCDEPTGNLDTTTSREVLALLAEIRTPARCVVMVTHDPSAAAFGTRLVSIRDGKIESDRPVVPAAAGVR